MNFKMPSNFKNKIRYDELYQEIGNFIKNTIKAKKEQHYIVLARVLSTKLPLQMSTQNYIRLRRLILLGCVVTK